MSQAKIYDLLKKNSGLFMSGREIAKLLDVNVMTIYANLRKLEPCNDIVFKEVKGKTKHLQKLYSYKQSDEKFEKAIKEFQTMRNEKRFEFTNADAIRQYMMIAELKKLNEVIGKWKVK